MHLQAQYKIQDYIAKINSENPNDYPSEIKLNGLGLINDDLQLLMEAISRNPQAAAKITRIWLHDNQLTSFSCEGLISLQELSLSGNQLTNACKTMLEAMRPSLQILTHSNRLNTQAANQARTNAMLTEHFSAATSGAEKYSSKKVPNDFLENNLSPAEPSRMQKLLNTSQQIKVSTSYANSNFKRSDVILTLPSKTKERVNDYLLQYSRKDDPTDITLKIFYKWFSAVSLYVFFLFLLDEKNKILSFHAESEFSKYDAPYKASSAAMFRTPRDFFISPQKRNILIVNGYDHNDAFYERPHMLYVMQTHAPDGVISVGTPQLGATLKEIREAVKYLPKEIPTTVYVATHGNWHNTYNGGMHHIALTPDEGAYSCDIIKEMAREFNHVDFLIDSCKAGSIVFECRGITNTNIVSFSPTHIISDSDFSSIYKELRSTKHKLDLSAKTFLELYFSATQTFSLHNSLFISSSGQPKSVSGIYCDLFATPITSKEASVIHANLDRIYGAWKISFLISVINNLHFYPFHKGLLMHMASLLDRTPKAYMNYAYSYLSDRELKDMIPIYKCKYNNLNDEELLASWLMDERHELLWQIEYYLELYQNYRDGDIFRFQKLLAFTKIYYKAKDCLFTSLKGVENPINFFDADGIKRAFNEASNKSTLICPLFNSRITLVGAGTSHNQLSFQQLFEKKHLSDSDSEAIKRFFYDITSKLGC